MKISFSDIAKNSLPGDDVLVLPIGEDKALGAFASLLDKQSGGLIKKALAGKEFTGKHGQCLLLLLPAGIKSRQLLLVGAGAGKSLSTRRWAELGGAVVPQLNAARASSATLLLDAVKNSSVPLAEAAAHVAHGVRLRSYRFDKYFTTKTADEKPTLSQLAVAGEKIKAAAAKPYAELEALESGITFTRDLVSEPGNIINPETLAEKCKELEALGVDVEIFGEEDMHRMGFGALLGVGQGSACESQMVIMRYNGLGKSAKSAPLAFVGKGVTFDTGGISIKPAGGMEEMKWDMGGAGTVIGLMRALAARKAKVNVVGAVGLVENMPGGNAQRPGDVVKSYSGQTIEVLNTDAEGRLVLADVLWYVQKHFKPRFIIDLATLTGAIIVALGTSRAGLFSNNDALAEQLFKMGERTGEEVWRLPLAEVYDKQINSDIADMQNIGKDREAGSITAAQFLQRFVNNVPWAHLDIAGTAWSKKDAPTCPKGATAFGVRLLNALVKEYYE